MCAQIKKNMSYFLPLEVVGRGSVRELLSFKLFHLAV